MVNSALLRTNTPPPRFAALLEIVPPVMVKLEVLSTNTPPAELNSVAVLPSIVPPFMVIEPLLTTTGLAYWLVDLNLEIVPPSIENVPLL